MNDFIKQFHFTYLAMTFHFDIGRITFKWTIIRGLQLIFSYFNCLFGSVYLSLIWPSVRITIPYKTIIDFPIEFINSTTLKSLNVRKV